MIVIRKEQMQVFDQETERVFNQKLFEHVRTNFSDESQEFSDEKLQQRIAELVTEAESFAITTQADIAEYVGMSFLHQDTAKSDECQNILNDSDLEAGTKLLQLNYFLDGKVKE